MKPINKFLIFSFLTSHLGLASALPIFTHTVDDLGLYTINVDASHEPTFFGLGVNNIAGTAIGTDVGINLNNDFSIRDANSDHMLAFTFTNIGNMTELTGLAYYEGEVNLNFSYSLALDTVEPEPPVPPPSPTPDPNQNVPEPSTFVLLGLGLLGIAASRFFKFRTS